jgi:hypothetical protein
VGSPVSMAAVTTFIAGVCLLPTRVLAYIQVQNTFIAGVCLLPTRVLAYIQVQNTFIAGVCLLPTRVLAYIQVQNTFIAGVCLLPTRVLAYIQVRVHHINSTFNSLWYLSGHWHPFRYTINGRKELVNTFLKGCWYV